MKIFSLLKFIFIAIFFINVYSASAQSHKNYNYELGFKSDNDAYLATKQDRYYTNGIFFYLRKALKNNTIKDSSNLLKKIWSFNAGQKMFNARSGKIKSVINIDRPITAYLYGSTALQWHYKNESFLKTEIQVGIIGPAANGKEVQEFIHNTFGFYKIDGWQFQLNNAFGINLQTDYLSLLYRSKNKQTDFALPLKINIGNTFSGASAGLLFRTGNINPFYHSYATESLVSASALSDKIKDQEFYFYAKPSINLVLYDATIKGGMFNTHTNEVVYKPIPWVFSQEVGASYSKKRLSFNVSYIFNTREIKSTATSHKYGSISMFYRFN